MLWAIKYMALDLWAQRALERQLVKQGDVITDVDVATEVELVVTEIYRDLLSKMDVGRFCTGAIFDNTPGGIRATELTTHRPLKSPPFSPQDRAWFRLLLPHLPRALGLMFRLDSARLPACPPKPC